MNDKHRRFAQNVVKGMSDVQAYIEAGYTPSSAEKNAHRLKDNEGIRNLIKELQEKADAEVVMSLNRKRSILAGIAHDQEVPEVARIRAIDVDSKLAGHYAPEKISLEGSLLEQILNGS